MEERDGTDMARLLVLRRKFSIGSKNSFFLFEKNGFI